MINVDGIKHLLRKASDVEIRMMLVQAKDMGIELDDKLIADLFKEGIAVDIVIRNADKDDFLPKRLEKYLENGSMWKDEGFVNIKIIKTPNVQVSNAHVLNPLEVVCLLAEILDNDFKVASELEGENGFVRMRFISAKNDRFLNIKEIREVLANVLSLDEYAFIVEEI